MGEEWEVQEKGQTRELAQKKNKQARAGERSNNKLFLDLSEDSNK